MHADSGVWLKAKEGRVEQSTLDQYRWAVDRHIVPLIGAIRLRDLSAEAVERGRLGRNPVSLTQPPKAERGSGRKGWTVEEARTFLGAISDHRLYALFHLGLVTGMRRGELLGLRWADVDLEHGAIAVVQQLATVRGQPVMKDLETESNIEWTATGSPMPTSMN